MRWWSDGFGQHTSDGVRGRIDSQQACESSGQIDGFGVLAISPRLKRQPVESEGHVRVVVVGRSVIGPPGRPYRIDGGDTHHVPASFRRIAVQIFAAEISIWNLAFG